MRVGVKTVKRRMDDASKVRSRDNPFSYLPHGAEAA